jgi:molybdopterin/thiamine biosynthesis adenylyltransferase
MQFALIICGLDSIEARRWINNMLVEMVDGENADTLKPLIDGGTEGKLKRRLQEYILTLRQGLRVNLKSSFQR